MRNYKRKTERQSWDVESKTQAIEAVHNKTMGFKKAADTFGVPKSTLEDRVKKLRLGTNLPEAASKGSIYTHTYILIENHYLLHF